MDPDSARWMTRNNNRTITVDDEVFTIINRYAQINGCTPGEAIKRIVMNETDGEVDQCEHGTPATKFCKACDDDLPF